MLAKQGRVLKASQYSKLPSCLPAQAAAYQYTRNQKKTLSCAGAWTARYRWTTECPFWTGRTHPGSHLGRPRGTQAAHGSPSLGLGLCLIGSSGQKQPSQDLPCVTKTDEARDGGRASLLLHSGAWWDSMEKSDTVSIYYLTGPMDLVRQGIRLQTGWPGSACSSILQLKVAAPL